MFTSFLSTIQTIGAITQISNNLTSLQCSTLSGQDPLCQQQLVLLRRRSTPDVHLHIARPAPQCSGALSSQCMHFGEFSIWDEFVAEEYHSCSCGKLNGRRESGNSLSI
ncbi:hypothetical protein CIPAW_04G063000 [Carya illinoinensis]|uniref:Uncharacterized protein n=1 Tax=Carya illinoinensis TaxID=32201 RepID=A0A8T1QQ48_CARIL|nr:hypothetical protein CIPAW_04G063000 [Carya illinoinensis]